MTEVWKVLLLVQNASTPAHTPRGKGGGTGLSLHSEIMHPFIHTCAI